MIIVCVMVVVLVFASFFVGYFTATKVFKKKSYNILLQRDAYKALNNEMQEELSILKEVLLENEGEDEEE